MLLCRGGGLCSYASGAVGGTVQAVTETIQQFMPITKDGWIPVYLATWLGSSPDTPVAPSGLSSQLMGQRGSTNGGMTVNSAGAAAVSSVAGVNMGSAAAVHSSWVGASAAQSWGVSRARSHGRTPRAPNLFERYGVMLLLPDVLRCVYGSMFYAALVCVLA